MTNSTRWRQQAFGLWTRLWRTDSMRYGLNCEMWIWMPLSARFKRLAPRRNLMHLQSPCSTTVTHQQESATEHSGLNFLPSEFERRENFPDLRSCAMTSP